MYDRAYWLRRELTARYTDKLLAPVVDADPGDEDTWQGVYPGMCINPETCRGKTHCPRDYSCCE